MFSPGTKRLRNLGHKPPDSPITPLVDNRRSLHHDDIPNRPTTGTPAPWVPRLSVLARTLPVSKSDKGDEIDPIKPVYVAEFPQMVRDEQSNLIQKRIPGEMSISGGVDKETSLCWIIVGYRLFIWNYLSPLASKKCIVLELPPSVSENVDINRPSYHNNSWLLCVVNWDSTSTRKDKVVQHCSSAGIVMCNQKSRTVIYWSDVYSESKMTPVTSLASADELEVTSTPADGKNNSNRQRQRNKIGSSGSSSFNSLITSPISDNQNVCVALACSSSGELWQFHCSPTGITRSKVYEDIPSLSSQDNDRGNKGYPRSLIWRFSNVSFEESTREFFLLTDREIQCFSINLTPDLKLSNLWSYEIIGTDADLGIKMDLAGQKRIWPLDLQVDDCGKVITILVATFCKDRVTGSSYTQYSLLTMQYKSGASISSDFERVLEKKAPVQVIIPKARVEDEEFLFAMRLRVGGKPLGSAIILSGDGTATVSHYYRNSTLLYQFDLPYDAGKVLDASVLPNADDGEDGAWIVLTEKAGIWAIPEKAVVLGGVEPPERSLSRKGSSNEGSALEERRNLTSSGNMAPRRASSEACNTGDRQRAVMTGIARRTAQDEESEAILGHCFHDFLSSGKVDGVLEKLKISGAFDRDGETNVFVRTSKSIVDSLAKHWTTTRGTEIVAIAVISTQLMDKQQKHKNFLQFLAISKCHEELCLRQRQSLQVILEHGEKLAGMIQLRELQKMINQSPLTRTGSPYASSNNEILGALWDLIQLVGERARRKTVLLMDRDNAEVFYSKVSDLEELFHCLSKQLEYVLSIDQPFRIQTQRACELSNACVAIIHTAMQFRNEYHMWYPPPEGLTPWYCQPVIRNGLLAIASFMLQLLSETSGLDISSKSDIYNHLEILTEVLLETYMGAITARVERGEDRKGLLDEYWNRRDALLDSLYQQVKSYVEAEYRDLNKGKEDQKDEILRKLSSRLLSIAKRHEGYRTLWKLCCDLNDSVLLRGLMHESMGPTGGFSYFVFKQLYERRQFSKILKLGEDFPEELSIFLKQHPNLLWLHEVFLHQFSLASETLHNLALSQDEGSFVGVDKGTHPDYASFEPTLADRKRLLNLSKIAAMAGGKDAESQRKMERIEADLKLLKLQEEIIELLPDNEAKDNIHQPLPAEDLIQLCLESGNRDLSLRTFYVFAWTSSSFRQSHRKLLEDSWKNAANQDDWEQLYQASISNGWSDEETLRVLRDTILFQASSTCYGPQAVTFEEGFDEVLSLRQENSEPSEFMKDSGSSVEAILRQHKDFPDAGKLMLTAIMLGSVQGDIILEEDPSLME